MKFRDMTKIDGIPAVDYFANMLVEFEKKQVDLTTAQREIGYMRQYNNQARLQLTAMVKGL